MIVLIAMVTKGANSISMELLPKGLPIRKNDMVDYIWIESREKKRIRLSSISLIPIYIL
jgi:hypothetical protein